MQMIWYHFKFIDLAIDATGLRQELVRAGSIFQLPVRAPAARIETTLERQAGSREGDAHE